MSDLTNRLPSQTYQNIVQIDGGVSNVAKRLQDGLGNNLPISLSITTASMATPITLLNITMAQRDAISNPTSGMLIFNTTTSFVEQYNGTSWNAFSQIYWW